MKNSLPSLMIFEKNVFVAKLYDYERQYQKGNTKIFTFICNIFELFQQKMIGFDKFIAIN